MNTEQLIVKKGRAVKTVSEITEILQKYGLSKSEHVTRRLIREGRIKGHFAEGPTDKRSGYVVLEKDVRKYIVQEIPAMKDIFEVLENLNDQENKAKKTTQKTTENAKAGE